MAFQKAKRKLYEKHRDATGTIDSLHAVFYLWDDQINPYAAQDESNGQWVDIWILTPEYTQILSLPAGGRAQALQDTIKVKLREAYKLWVQNYRQRPTVPTDQQTTTELGTDTITNLN